MAEETVASVSSQAKAFQTAAALPRTLIGGTSSMRAAGETYLPCNPAEHPTQYDRRLESTFLFNAYERALQMLVGKVFSERPILGDDVPEQIEEWVKDIDLQGRDLAMFAEDLLGDAINVGMVHVLVDMQISQAVQEGRVPTLEDERREGLRPYLTMIPADTVIGWRSRRVRGATRLAQIRIKEVAEVDSGQWGTEPRERVCVWYSADGEGEDDWARWELWEKVVVERQEKERWVLLGKGDMRPFREIPLVTLYTGRTGWFEARPPLDDLAWKNVEHWQSTSEQRNVLHTGRIPILFGSGFKDRERKSKKVIGTLVAWMTGDSGARLGYVETSGQAIGHGFRDLEMIREDMSVLAMQPLLQRPTGNETATAKAIDTAEADSRLQAWALSLSDVLVQCLDHLATWGGLESGGGTVSISTDFGLGEQNQENLKIAQASRAQGDISRETLWGIMEKHGVFFDTWTPEEETRRLLVEGQDEPPEEEEEEEIEVEEEEGGE